jgi:hypothetical protein
LFGKFEPRLGLKRGRHPFRFLFALDCFLAAQFRLGQGHSRLEEKPRESAQRSIVTVAYVILHLADFQWNQYDVPAFKRHGATNQYLQQDPSEERTSDRK